MAMLRFIVAFSLHESKRKPTTTAYRQQDEGSLTSLPLKCLVNICRQTDQRSLSDVSQNSGLGLLAYLHLGFFAGRAGRSCPLRDPEEEMVEYQEEGNDMRAHTIRMHARFQKSFRRITPQGQQERGFQVQVPRNPARSLEL